jgi:hypothetical protein
VYYTLSRDVKPGEEAMDKTEFEQLITDFQMVTKAKQYTIIVFCSLQQLGTFETVLKHKTNIKPQTAVWHRTDAMFSNQYTECFASAAEGVLFGYHDREAAAGKEGKKATWQVPDRELQNVFSFKQAVSQKVTHHPFKPEQSNIQRKFHLFHLSVSDSSCLTF